MAKTSKNNRIHKGWKILGIHIYVPNRVKRFQYQCTGCGVKVLAGQPFSEVVGGMECK